MDACVRIARGAGVAAGFLALLFGSGCAAFGLQPQPARPATSRPSEPSAIVKGAGADKTKLAGDGAQVDASDNEIERWARQMSERPRTAPGAKRPRPSARSLAADPSPFGYDDTAGEQELEAAPASTSAKPRVAPLEAAGQTSAAAPRKPTLPPTVNGVRAVAEVAPPPVSARDAAPNEPAQSDAPRDLRALLASIAGESRDNQSFREQLDQRVLHLLAGDEAAARAPLQLVTDQQQQMAQHFLDMLAAIRAGHGGEPVSEANRVLGELEKLQDSLTEVGELQLSDLQVCRAVRGYGQYDKFEPAQFLAGRANEVVIYNELRNFISRREDDGRYHAEFSLRTRVMTRTGDTVVDLEDPQIVDRCQTRRRDCFIPRLVRLPATLAPGDYVVKSTVVDKIGQEGGRAVREPAACRRGAASRAAAEAAVERSTVYSSAVPSTL